MKRSSVVLGTESRREPQSDRAEEASFTIQGEFGYSGNPKDVYGNERDGLFGDVITQGLVKAF